MANNLVLSLASLLLAVMSCGGPPVREPPVREPGRLPAPEVAPAARQPAGSDIVIINETGEEIRYTVESPEPAAMTLAPSARHSYGTEAAPLRVSYRRGDDLTLQQRLDAGKQYAFRPGRDQGLGLYLRRKPGSGSAVAPPYVSTPMVVVERILELAEVGAGDVVYDIGCGDGRIVNTAARRFGARGVGLDIDPDLIARAVAASRAAGTDHLVTFRIEDATTGDFSEATVVTLYLTSSFNELLRPHLEAQLRPGTRVVAHDIRVPGWQSRLSTFVPLQDDSGNEHRLFLYRMPS